MKTQKAVEDRVRVLFSRGLFGAESEYVSLSDRLQKLRDEDADRTTPIGAIEDLFYVPQYERVSGDADLMPTN